MALTLDQCLKQLALQGVDITVEEFCDAAWLAARGFSHGQARDMQLPEAPGTGDAQAQPVAQKPQNSISSKTAERSAIESPKTPQPVSTQPLHALGGSGSEKMRGHVLSLPAAPALSCGVEMDRALRPLRQRRPLAQQATVIDEEATVAAIAETGLWHVVKRPARGRWLDIEIVVEQSPTMRLWQETAMEFRQLLVRACAPRSIRSYFLSWTRDEGLQLRASGGRPVSLQRPVEGGHCKVILVLSDAMSFGWLTGFIPELMAQWAARCPTTLMHLLPVSMWKRSALRQVKVTSLHQPRSPVLAAGEDVWPPITVATLDPASLRSYSRLLAGTGSEGMVCYRGSRAQFSVAEMNQRRLSRPFNPQRLNPEDVDNTFQRFEQFSSEGARKLARHLASAPLLLPVMRLIQRVLVPDPAPAQLAEIFLSGILYKHSAEGGENAAQIEYDFLPGIRERLLDLGGLDAAEKTIRLLSRYFEQRLGQGGFFTALLQDPHAVEKEWKVVGTGGQARSFARLEKLLLDRMGLSEVTQKSATSEDSTSRQAKSESSTKFIERHRAPRVHITYELDINGAPKKVELPFVVGVLADLSGMFLAERPLPDVKDRRFLEFDIDNFDNRMKDIRPALYLNVPDLLHGVPIDATHEAVSALRNQQVPATGPLPTSGTHSVVVNGAKVWLGVEGDPAHMLKYTLYQKTLDITLTFERMEDFSPGAVVRQIGPLAELLQERTEITNLLSYIDTRIDAEETLAKLITDPEALESIASASLSGMDIHRSSNPGADLLRLVAEQATPSTYSRERKKEHRAQVRSAVQTLVRQISHRHISTSGDNVYTPIQQAVAEIDRDLTRQVNAVMHHPEFLRLEGAWRGLHYLVFNTEWGLDLKFRVMNITKKEIHRTLASFRGSDWDQSPLFSKVYEYEFGTPGGEPYGCLIGDFEFDHSPADVQVLEGMARIASTAHCPFIAAVAPAVMNLESWQQLGNPRDMPKIFETAEYAAWRSLRSNENSRYIGLTLPRFLARLPYSIKNNPVDDFAFEEETSLSGHQHFVWANAAYAMATNITRASKRYGWCAQIRGVESGGLVENIPVHTFPTDDGGVDMKCPTEIAITDRREHELARLGFMPLSHWKNTDFAAFIGAQSLHKPPQFEDKDATAAANISARFPYLFACCRFAHYLKCIVRDKIGSFRERDEMESWLNHWIMNYVTDSSASDEVKAQKPLAAAEISLHDDDQNPGYYRADVRLRPHFQLEGVNVSLPLVMRLPSERRH